MIKVYVTETNGFIGETVCEKLLAEGYQVQERLDLQITLQPYGIICWD